jgi:hypothetical protein
LIAHPNTISHSLDVDDCADAYVVRDEHPDRKAMAQQPSTCRMAGMKQHRKSAMPLPDSIYRQQSMLDEHRLF